MVAHNGYADKAVARGSAGEMGDVFHVLTGQFHGSQTIDNARREATGANADNTPQLLNPTLVARLASFCFSPLADRGASC